MQDWSVTYTIAHGNAGSLTHWKRPGIEPASSWILVRLVLLSHDGNSSSLLMCSLKQKCFKFWCPMYLLLVLSVYIWIYTSFFFLFLMAASAYGSSQAGDWIRTTAVAMPDPLIHCGGAGSQTCTSAVRCTASGWGCLSINLCMMSPPDETPVLRMPVQHVA